MDRRSLGYEGRSAADLIQRLRTRGIENERLLSAFARMDRTIFVPPEGRDDAYRDVPVAIPRGQVTTQPSLIAVMVDALDLKAQESVLEIGTGLGFQTAILSCLCRRVESIERFGDLSDLASSNLVKAGVKNACLHVGDGSFGLPKKAPFDAILCSAAAQEVPPALENQLSDGGRLVIPLGPGGDERVTLFRKVAGRLRRVRVLTWAHFVRLEGKGVLASMEPLKKVV